MARWMIEGHDGGQPPELQQTVDCDEQTVRLLLARLVARHLSTVEIIDATVGSRTDFEVRPNLGAKQRSFMTTGSGHHYAARQVD